MNFDFQITIPGYEPLVQNNRTIYYYKIKAFFLNKTWMTERRYKEFFRLNQDLNSVFADVPKLPKKSYFPLTNVADIEKRRIELQQYMQELICRREILINEYFLNFLESNKEGDPKDNQLVKLMGKHVNPFFGVRSCHFLSKKKILFTVNSDMKVSSRFDSYLSNVGKISANQQNSDYSWVGSLECLLKNSNSEFVFTKIWSRGFPVQAICSDYHNVKSLLFVGLDNGIIIGIQVHAEFNYLNYTEIYSRCIHKSRVMAIFIDSTLECVYSISEDKTFKITNYVENIVMFDVVVSNKKLTNMVVEKHNKRIMITDRGGQLHIYAIKIEKIEKIKAIQTESFKSIRGLVTDSTNNLCFMCSHEDGLLHVVNLNHPGKESLAKQIRCVMTKAKARVLELSKKRNEIYVGNEDGTIFIFLVWDIERPIYAFKTHLQCICHITVIDEEDLLLTSSKCKSLKFWKLPEKWETDPIVKNGEIQDIEKSMMYEEKKISSVSSLEKDFNELKIVIDKKYSNQSKSEPKLPQAVPGKMILKNDSDDDLDGWNQ